MTDPTPDSKPPAFATLQKGDKVQQYTIHKQVGSGGTSVVFKADDELLGTSVAIKQFIQTDDSDDSARIDKIRAEARLHKEATADDAPHLVKLLDVVDGPHGLLLISEYVDGPSLEQILAQNTAPMPSKQALGIAAATALALKTIHDKGIVHLDLKPANILMPRSGGLKLSDFGLADSRAEPAAPTAGTARYMAPELFNQQKIDGRADLYALGMMLYEMLVGREKFDQAFKLILRDQRNQAVRWMKWHTNPRSKAQPINELLPGISPRLAELVAKLMEKDPEQRVGSAKQLIKAIKRHLAGKDEGPLFEDDGDTLEEVPASTTTPGETAVVPRKNPALKYALIAACVCVLIGGAVGGWTYMQQLNEQKSQQAALEDDLDAASDAYRNGEYERAVVLFDQLIEKLPGTSPMLTHAEARRLLAQGRADAEAGRHDEAITAFEQAAEMGGVYRDRARPLIDNTQQAKAFDNTLAKIESLIQANNYAQARTELDAWRELAASEKEKQALQALGAKLEDQLARWQVTSLVRQAQDLADRGRRDEAIELLNDAPKRVAVTTLLDELQAQAAYEQAVTQGELALDRGDTEKAIELYEAALEARPDQALQEKLLDLKSDWLVEEGLRMLAIGNTVDADRMLTEALGYRPDNERAREALARIATSGRRQSFIDAGDAAMDREDYPTAVTQYDNAMKLGVDEALTTKLTRARVQAQLEKSRDLLATGQVDEAMELVNQAKVMASDSPDVAAVLQEVEARSLYLQHLKAGDEARGRSKFGDAKRHYLQAKDALNTPQINERLDETEYDHLLAQARNYIAAEEYPSAIAQLRIAAGIRMTDEVQKLLDTIQEKAPDAGGL